MSRRSGRDFRETASEAMLRLGDAIRRVVFGSSETAGGQWGIRGYETADVCEGEDDDPVDVFQGMYVYARPAAADRAEGIMLNVGAHAQHPTIAALRNEDARLRYVDEFGDLAAGEVAIFNSAGKTRIHISAAGDVILEVESGQEILARKTGGTALALATKADVDAIESFQKLHFDTAAGHTHAGLGTPPITGAGSGTGFSVPAATGTTVLKGE